MKRQAITKVGTIKSIPMISAALFFFLSLAVPLVFAQKENLPAKKDDSVYAELAKAPKKAASRRNPLKNDPEAVAVGRKLFELHCAECHGEDAEGGRKAPSLRAREVQQATPGTLFWILTNGVVRRGMPVWSKLPEPQRWQIVSYLRSLAAAESHPSDRGSFCDLRPSPRIKREYDNGCAPNRAGIDTI